MLVGAYRVPTERWAYTPPHIHPPLGTLEAVPYLALSRVSSAMHCLPCTSRTAPRHLDTSTPRHPTPYPPTPSLTLFILPHPSSSFLSSLILPHPPSPSLTLPHFLILPHPSLSVSSSSPGTLSVGFMLFAEYCQLVLALVEIWVTSVSDLLTMATTYYGHYLLWPLPHYDHYLTMATAYLCHYPLWSLPTGVSFFGRCGRARSSR